MDRTDSDKAESNSPDPPPGQFAGRQYIAELVNELQSIRPEDLRGVDRFPPAFELRYAPVQFRSILAIATRFLEVNPSQISARRSKQVENTLVNLLALVDEVVRAPTRDPSQSARRKISEEAQKKLGEILEFFTVLESELEKAEPRGLGSRSETPLSPNELADMERTRAELKKTRAELADMEARQAKISAELEARGALVEATRSETGSVGAEELAIAYEDQAIHHDRQWKTWGIALASSVIVALIAGYMVLDGNRPPDDATTAQIVSRVAIDLLIIGLLIYMVRVTSHQFSVHRHLGAVAHNKAAALATFARIVNSGSSAEARDRLTDVLAQYVFASDNTGFLTGSGDQITLLERLAGPIGQRLSPPT
jgi:energy-converting hydrogenase Eha subunit A